MIFSSIPSLSHCPIFLSVTKALLASHSSQFYSFLSVLCGSCVDGRNVICRKGVKDAVQFATCKRTCQNPTYSLAVSTEIKYIYASLRRKSESPPITQCSLARPTIHAPREGSKSARSLSPFGDSMGSEEKKGAEIGRTPQGVFKTLKKGSKRRTARRKERRLIERLRQKQIVWLCGHVLETMR